LILMADAEAMTGISLQEVSKWRRRLADPEKYREMLYGAAYHKTMTMRSTKTVRAAARAGTSVAGYA
jgi:hypothetical protein